MGQRDILTDIAKALDVFHISYFLSGSFASSYYGYPRATHDIDLVVYIEHADDRPLLSAMRSLGETYLMDTQMIGNALLHKSLFDILHVESGIKVDFWISKETPFAASCFQRKQKIRINKQDVSIISAEDLLLFKLVWYTKGESERQKRDAAGVWHIQGKKLDKRYLSFWAKQLGVTSLLRDLPRTNYQPW